MHLSDFSLLDLTHPLDPNVPTWTGGCGFRLEVKQDYDEIFRVQQIKMHAGVGTHMDAPSHRFEGAPSIHQIPLENLITPACVIDVSKRADAHYEISVDDIHEYEKKHGIIPKNGLVIGYTGWDRFWKDPQKYRNADGNGLMRFPSFSAQAAEVLLQRGIAGIAIDTISPDSPASTFPVHKIILGAGKYIIENIANASKLPPHGATVISLPLYATDATEAPSRVIGIYH